MVYVSPKEIFFYVYNCFVGFQTMEAFISATYNLFGNTLEMIIFVLLLCWHEKASRAQLATQQQ